MGYTKIAEDYQIGGRYIGRIEQTITAAEVAAITPAGVSVTVAIDGFPARAIPVAARIKLNTNFAGADTVTAKVGDAGNDDELLEATNIKTGAAAEFLAAPAANPQLGIEEAAYAPIVTFDVTGSGIDNADLSAGSLTVVIFYEKFNFNK